MDWRFHIEQWRVLPSLLAVMRARRGSHPGDHPLVLALSLQRFTTLGRALNNGLGIVCSVT